MMNIDKYFDKKLEITTKDKTYNIEKVQLFIHDSSSFCGEAYILREDSGDLLRIKEVYSLEKNRLRFLYDKFEDPKTYETFEKSEDGSTETPIMVIESCKKKTTNIGSIGNIKKINSDRIEKAEDKSKEFQPLILKLLRKNKKQEASETQVENLLKAA